MVYCRFIALILLSFIILACAASKVSKSPDSEHINNAKRYLRSLGAYELFMVAIDRKLESMNKVQPGGNVEFLRRVFSEITEEEFEEFTAPAYVRHLSEKHLVEIVRFSESNTGKRFFQLVYARKIETQSNITKDDIRQFNADEIAEIMKFSLSDAAEAMKQANPAITRDIDAAENHFVEAKIREYLKRN
jgi:hypothetical protein